MDSNHRPRAYQARALTCWAMSPQLGWTRARTYFSLAGKLSPGPLLWLTLFLQWSWTSALRIVSASLLRFRACPVKAIGFPSHFRDGDDGIRTHDPLLAGQVLSQLSYTPMSVTHRPLNFLFFSFTMNNEWISYITGFLWKIPHLWGIFMCLLVISRFQLPVMQARLTQNWTTTFVLLSGYQLVP